jgi:sortase (surface protein transpeptidase)
MRQKDKTSISRWWPAISRLPLLSVTSRGSNSSAKRARHVYIRLSPKKKLSVTLRRFRTNPAARSKKIKQAVLPLYFVPYKEIALQLDKPKAAGKRSKSDIRKIFWGQTFARLLISFGLIGSIAFATDARQNSTSLESVKLYTPVVAQPSPIVQEPKGLPRSEPSQLHIPKINVRSAVMQVGNNADGTMEVPPLHQEITGWYKHGPTPGEVGPSVIIGHVDTKDGPSIFWRLRELQPGDAVEVSRADGQIAKFKVDTVKQFDQANFPTEEVYGNIDHAGLRLITCGGVFNKRTGKYSHNTVVFATLMK